MFRGPTGGERADVDNGGGREIRQFGRESVQVARRLRAMLEDLLDGLPEEREPAVRQELDLTARTVERSFPEPEDRARAHMPDHQGAGVSRAARPRDAAQGRDKRP